MDCKLLVQLVRLKHQRNVAEVLIMDKQKTGNLIKEARVKKNYTQAELGDLLGVSNKAVSRWENGDSFPDVGILENLAAVLDVRIQDVITGDIGIQDESVVTEVVRVAKLQQKDKKRKVVRECAFVVAILCCIISRYLALGNNSILFVNDSILVYVILMVVSFALMLVGHESKIEVNKNDTDKFCKYMKVVSVLSLLWSILMTWCVYIMVINGCTPFGIEFSSVGHFINWQLIGLFILNLAITTFELYRYEKNDEVIHWGWFISVAVMYMTILYSDMLHRMSYPQEVFESLVIRTLVVLATAGVSLGVAKIVKVKANRSENKS